MWWQSTLCQMARRKRNRIIHGEDMARPKKEEGEKVLRTLITYRPDQAEKVRLLAKQKRLSEAAQAVIDAAEI